MSNQSWTKEINGRTRTLTFYVEDRYTDVEPTGTVEVSIELFEQMLTELGYVKEN